MTANTTAFKIFKKTSQLLVKTRVHKILWFVEPLYDKIFALLYKNQKVRTLQGSKMYLDVSHPHPGMRKTFQTYALNNIHEPETTELFKRLINRGDTIVDFGANIGYFTLLAARLTGKKGIVYAFEPEPTNFKFLQKNISLNGYDNVKAFQKAVSSENGKTELFICDYDTGHHTINSYNGIKAYSKGRKSQMHSIEIETIKLDDFLKGKKIDLMKVDAEGSEFLAIEGMKGLLKKNKDIKIVLEYFPLLVKNMGGDPIKMIQDLLDMGFRIDLIPEDYNANNKNLKQITSAEILRRICRGDEHVNLLVHYQDKPLI